MVLNELDELKQLLFAEEQRDISALHQRISDPRQRAQDMAESLSESISLSTDKGPLLTQSLQAPVSECVKYLAREQTQIFADALFPAIMPAIRRSILETLRDFLQTINQTIDQSFSVRGLRWRLEALRTGVPFHEIVLTHTLVYRVEQVFLIHLKSGLLINHVSHPHVVIKDRDAVSAMFTAIQDFVQDSFGTEGTSSLDSIEIGGQTTWLIYGSHIMLACVIRGIAPLKLRERYRLVLEDIDRRFGKNLINFVGDGATVSYLKPILHSCLDLELKGSAKTYAQNRLRPPPALLGFMVILVSLIVYWLIINALEERRFDALRMTLEASPGIMVIDSSTHQGKRVFRGLRDPLATQPMKLAQSLGLDKDKVEFLMTAYHSMEAPIVRQRVYQLLDIPKSVQVTLSDGVLEASGIAPYPWITKVKAYGRYLSGVNRIDLSKVTVDDKSLQQAATALLNPPKSAALQVERRRLIISGEAPWSWIQPLPERIADIEGIIDVNTEHLDSRESIELQSLREKINNQNLFFSSGIQLRADSWSELQQMIPKLRRMSNLAETIGFTVRITLSGYTDGTGAPELNQRLRDQRANEVLRLLAQAGLNPKLFTIGKTRDLPGLKSVNSQQRRVTISVHLEKADLSRLFSE